MFARPTHRKSAMPRGDFVKTWVESCYSTVEDAAADSVKFRIMPVAWNMH